MVLLWVFIPISNVREDIYSNRKCFDLTPIFVSMFKLDYLAQKGRCTASITTLFQKRQLVKESNTPVNILSIRSFAYRF
jgi:hypothetical protein